MGLLGSRFLNSAAAASALLLVAGADGQARSRPHEAPGGPVLHGSSRTKAALSPLNREIPALAKGIDHLLIVSPEDIVPAKERQRIARDGGPNPDLTRFYPPGLPERRTYDLFRRARTPMPAPFMGFAASEAAGTLLRETFEALAGEAPHARALRDPAGNLCIVAGARIRFDVVTIAASQTGLDRALISPPLLKSGQRLFYDLVMLHEISHCGQQDAPPTGSTLGKARTDLAAEIDADRKAAASLRRLNPLDPDAERAIAFVEAVRGVTAIRGNTGISDPASFADHLNDPGPRGSGLRADDFMLAAKLVVTAKNIHAGLLAARPDMLAADTAQMRGYLAAERLHTASLDRIVAHAKGRPAPLGAMLTDGDPALEYVAVRGVAGALRSRIAADPAPPAHERAALRLCEDYIAGIETIAPTIAAMSVVRQMSSKPEGQPPDIAARSMLPLDLARKAALLGDARPRRGRSSHAAGGPGSTDAILRALAAPGGGFARGLRPQ